MMIVVCSILLCCGHPIFEGKEAHYYIVMAMADKPVKVNIEMNNCGVRCLHR